MTERKRLRPMRTRREIREAMGAITLMGVFARQTGNEDLESAASFAVGALAWAIDERGEFDKFREHFAGALARVVHDFDQAQAAVREQEEPDDAE